MQMSSQLWGCPNSLQVNLRVTLGIVRSHFSRTLRVWQLETTHPRLWQWCYTVLGVGVLETYLEKNYIKNLFNHPYGTDHSASRIRCHLSVSSIQPVFPQSWNRWPGLFLWLSTRWSSWRECKGHIVGEEMTSMYMFICILFFYSTYSWLRATYLCT